MESNNKVLHIFQSNNDGKALLEEVISDESRYWIYELIEQSQNASQFIETLKSADHDFYTRVEAYKNLNEALKTAAEEENNINNEINISDNRENRINNINSKINNSRNIFMNSNQNIININEVNNNNGEQINGIYNNIVEHEQKKYGKKGQMGYVLNMFKEDKVCGQTFLDMLLHDKREESKAVLDLIIVSKSAVEFLDAINHPEYKYYYDIMKAMSQGPDSKSEKKVEFAKNSVMYKLQETKGEEQNNMGNEINVAEEMDEQKNLEPKKIHEIFCEVIRGNGTGALNQTKVKIWEFYQDSLKRAEENKISTKMEAVYKDFNLTQGELKRLKQDKYDQKTREGYIEYLEGKNFEKKELQKMSTGELFDLKKQIYFSEKKNKEQSKKQNESELFEGKNGKKFREEIDDIKINFEDDLNTVKNYNGDNKDNGSSTEKHKNKNCEIF